MDKIPFWEKYTLSIDEAAAYFRIGRDKLYKLVNENPDADFILWNGTRAQIKRKKFECALNGGREWNSLQINGNPICLFAWKIYIQIQSIGISILSIL